MLHQPGYLVQTITPVLVNIREESHNLLDRNTGPMSVNPEAHLMYEHLGHYVFPVFLGITHYGKRFLVEVIMVPEFKNCIDPLGTPQAEIRSP